MGSIERELRDQVFVSLRHVCSRAEPVGWEEGTCRRGGITEHKWKGRPWPLEETLPSHWRESSCDARRAVGVGVRRRWGSLSIASCTSVKFKAKALAEGGRRC